MLYITTALRRFLFLHVQNSGANYAIVAHKAAQDFCRWQGA
jgi:hypothetical protein